MKTCCEKTAGFAVCLDDQTEADMDEAALALNLPQGDYEGFGDGFRK